VLCIDVNAGAVVLGVGRMDVDQMGGFVAETTGLIWRQSITLFYTKYAGIFFVFVLSLFQSQMSLE
jgi:hypothetical protein